MTDQEIIRKAVDKASKNGYTGWKSFVPAFPLLKVKSKKKLKELFDTTLFLYSISILSLFYKEKIIFSHDFAEHFWGKEKYGRCPYRQPIWQYYLQQMVLEKEPLKYLEKHL